MKRRLSLLVLVVLVAMLLPVAASADNLYLPSLQNGTRDWFTVGDVVAWSNAAGNVMPIGCTAIATQPELLFTSCTVSQAQPLTLVWSDAAGKVVAQ
jgi:hypothetical protein